VAADGPSLGGTFEGGDNAALWTAAAEAGGRCRRIGVRRRKPGIAGALAQEPNQVSGLTVVQDDGFARLAWTPVAGATDYQIERTPVDDANAPTGEAAIVGVWQPERTVTPDSPTFADSGFALGDRFQRVRARLATEAEPFSDPVFATTLPQWGTGPGASLRTGYETSGDGTYTSDAD
jgi:hypothetical protein